MLCYRLNINLAGGYVIFRSVPRIVAWATAAHSFPRHTARLFVYDCKMSYTWLLYGLLWWKLLYHVTCGWSLINKIIAHLLYHSNAGDNFIDLPMPVHTRNPRIMKKLLPNCCMRLTCTKLWLTAFVSCSLSLWFWRQAHAYTII